ncbi:MAG: YsnF/AvaK domain-containing protein, partial [Deinococcus sp.]|nr:YsnF/AvaK domain-containing protein [Deinococcus sp.]
MTDNLKPGERYLEAAGDQTDLTTQTVQNAQTDLSAGRDVARGQLGTDTALGGERDLRTEATDLLAGQTDRLVLYEERARVDVVRESLGAVTVRKLVTEREEMVPVTLRSEYLEIVVHEGAGRVRMDGQELQPGQTYQVELTTERASVHKELVPISEVSLEKRAVAEDVQQTVTLRREVLDVEDPQNLIANRSELEG